MEISCENRFSDYKNLCKSTWSSNKRRTVRNGPVFSKRGDKVVFNFRHFVKPEQIIKEYTSVNIYNKPRFVRTDKKNPPNNLPTINDSETTANVDLHDRKSKPNSKHEKTQMHLDVAESKTCRKKHIKINNEPKEIKNIRAILPAKRVSATHNFVYEFNPFGKSTSNLETSTNLQTVSTFGQGDALSKHQSVKQTSTTTQVRSKAVFPKLHMRTDFTPDCSEKQNYVGSRNQNTNLPVIKKLESVEKKFLKETGKRNITEISEIDREVEKVKSDWQVLRAAKGWAQGKDYVSNIRTKRLYETLEKVTREIDKIQNSYLDPKTNHYLRKRASKILEPSQPSSAEQCSRIRNMLFPKEKSSDKSNKFDENNFLENIPNSVLKNVLVSEDSIHLQMKKPETQRRSLFSNMDVKDIKGDIKSDDRLSIDCNNRTNVDCLNLSLRNLISQKIGSNIDKYSDDYVNETEYFLGDKKGTIKELEPSSDDVTNMLAKLRVDSFEDCVLEDDLNSIDEDQSVLEAKGNKKNMGVEDCIQAVFDKEIETKSLIDEKSSDDYLFLQKNISSNDKKLFDTAIQAGTIPTLKKNTFLEMGLQSLRNDLPKNMLSGVLQSEYLKKDSSLKPM